MIPHWLRKTSTIPLSLLLLLSFFVCGCGRLGSFTDSGIAKALTDGSLLEAAGKPQGISSGGGGHGVANNGYSTNVDANFDVAVMSGTPGQLLAAFREEVGRKIESMGGSIHGRGVSGGENDVTAFSYDYEYGKNAGIVRVDSHVNANGRIIVEILCYEHVR